MAAVEFFPVLVTLAVLALGATAVSAIFDCKIATAFGLIATGFGLMLLPLCAANPALEPSLISIWAFTILTLAMSTTAFCACVLEGMDDAVQVVPVEDEPPFVSNLDPQTAPAAMSIRPLIAWARRINIHLPSQEHAHA